MSCDGQGAIPRVIVNIAVAVWRTLASLVTEGLQLWRMLASLVTEEWMEMDGYRRMDGDGMENAG